MRDNVFIVGLLIKLALFFTAESLITQEWYVPFLDHSITQYSLDPWAKWVNAGGDERAFPYGLAMYFMFLPLVTVASALGLHTQHVYELVLLGFDIAILLVLLNSFPKKHRLIIYLFWLSPISFVATYIVGFNDIIPTAFLLITFVTLTQKRFIISGLALALTISFKFSFVVAAPIIIFYLFNNPAKRQRMNAFLSAFLISSTFLWMPILLSNEARQMLLMNQEVERLYALKIMFGDHYGIYPVPLLYIILLYIIWRVRRMSTKMFSSLLGVTLLALVLLIPAQAGWFLWSLPFMVIYQLQSNRVSMVLYFLLTCNFTILSLVTTQSLYDVVIFNKILASATNLFFSHEKIVLLLITLMTAIGGLICVRIWREDISRDDFYLFNRKPYSIGIAGDSGSGKDTLSEAIVGIFGNHSATNVTGDNYHIWDRQGSIWQALTHLNPIANHLERYESDIINLIKGKTIYSTHYDHSIGKFSQPIKYQPRDVIIASGLHALYLPRLRSLLDLKIFLDMDNDLRKYLKIQRDVHTRGKSLVSVKASISKREPDAKRYIHPQINHADLIFSLAPLRSISVNTVNEHHNVQTKLSVRMRAGTGEASLLRTLAGLYGLMFNLDYSENRQWVDIDIDGDLYECDTKAVATSLYPRLIELFDLKPIWQGGTLGIMLLFILSHINYSLEKAIKS
jgi:uridine kinase